MSNTLTTEQISDEMWKKLHIVILSLKNAYIIKVLSVFSSFVRHIISSIKSLYVCDREITIIVRQVLFIVDSTAHVFLLIED